MIEIDFNSLREAYLCGHIGEHNAEQIFITLKDEMIDRTAKYVLAFSSGNKTLYESKPMSIIGKDNLLFTIPQEVTNIPVDSTSNIVEMQVYQYMSGRLLRKSDHVNIVFSGNSYDKKHEFSNKPSVPEHSNHGQCHHGHHGDSCHDCHNHEKEDNEHCCKPDITEDVRRAIDMAHEHQNASVLDDLSDEGNHLKYKDKVILPNTSVISGDVFDYNIPNNSLFYLTSEATNLNGDTCEEGLYLFIDQEFINMSRMVDDDNKFIEIDDQGRIYIYECDGIEINGDRVELYVNSGREKRFIGNIDVLSSLEIGDDGKPYINGQRLITESDNNPISIVDNPSLLTNRYEDGSIAIAVNNYLETTPINRIMDYDREYTGQVEDKDSEYSNERIILSRNIEFNRELCDKIVDYASVDDIEYVRIDSRDIVYEEPINYYRKTHDNKYRRVSGLRRGDTLYGLYYIRSRDVHLPSLEVLEAEEPGMLIRLLPLLDQGDNNYLIVESVDSLSGDDIELSRNSYVIEVDMKGTYNRCVHYEGKRIFIASLSYIPYRDSGSINVSYNMFDSSDQHLYTLHIEHPQWVAIVIDADRLENFLLNVRYNVDIDAEDIDPRDILSMIYTIYDFDVSKVVLKSISIDNAPLFDTPDYNGILSRIVSELSEGLYIKNNGRWKCFSHYHGNFNILDSIRTPAISRISCHDGYIYAKRSNGSSTGVYMDLSSVTHIEVNDGVLCVEYGGGTTEHYSIQPDQDGRYITSVTIEDENSERHLVVTYSDEDRDEYTLDNSGSSSDNNNNNNISIDDTNELYTEYTFNTGSENPTVVTIPKTRQIRFTDNPESDSYSLTRDNDQRYIGISRHTSVDDLELLTNSDFDWIYIGQYSAQQDTQSTDIEEQQHYDDSTFEGIHSIVRAGLASKYYDIGDLISVHHSIYGEIDLRVIGFDQDIVYDSEGNQVEHSMTVESTVVINNGYPMEYARDNSNNDYVSDDYHTMNAGFADYSISSMREWLNCEHIDYQYNGPVYRYRRIPDINEFSHIINNAPEVILSSEHDHIVDGVQYYDSNDNPIDISNVDPSSNPYVNGWKIKKYKGGAYSDKVITTDSVPVVGKRYITIADDTFSYTNVYPGGGYSIYSETVFKEVYFSAGESFDDAIYYEYKPVYVRTSNSGYEQVPLEDDPRTYTSADNYYYERFYIENDESNYISMEEPGFMYGLDPDFISIIGYVEKRVVDGCDNTYTIRDRVFILSAYEMGYSDNYVEDGLYSIASGNYSGKYRYYRNIRDMNKLIKLDTNSTPTDYYLRTGYSGAYYNGLYSPVFYGTIDSSGGYKIIRTGANVDQEIGVSPAFCII